MKPTLLQALPFLVLDLESALAHLGRGKLAGQLRAAVIDGWSYDAHADSAYLRLGSPSMPGAADRSASAQPGEAVSVFDELGITLDTDASGRLTGMEITEAKAIVAQLESGTGG